MCRLRLIRGIISSCSRWYNVGIDRHQLVNMAEQARAEMAVETLNVVVDRGYYEGEELVPVSASQPQRKGYPHCARQGEWSATQVARLLERMPA